MKNLDTYAGNCGQSITDVMMKVNQGKIKYRVHSKGRWLPWVTGYDVNNFKNGYAGNGVPIDGIQIVYTSENKTTKKAYYRVSQLKRNYFDWQINITTDYDMDGYAGNVNGQPIDRLQIQIK